MNKDVAQIFENRIKGHARGRQMGLRMKLLSFIDENKKPSISTRF